MGVKSVTAICAAAELMPGWQKALLGRFNGGNNIVLQHGLPLTPQSGSASVHSSRLLLCSAMEAITAFLQALPSSALPKITLLDQLARAARWVSMAAPLSPEAHLAASMEQALVAAAGAECLDDLRNRQHWEVRPSLLALHCVQPGSMARGENA